MLVVCFSFLYEEVLVGDARDSVLDCLLLIVVLCVVLSLLISWAYRFNFEGFWRTFVTLCAMLAVKP